MVLKLVLLGAWVCEAVTASHLELQEGNLCKEVNGTQWLFKNLEDCPKLPNNVKAWEVNQVCKPKGRDVIVCCEPKASPVGEKAKEMCKSYAELVFTKLPNFTSEDLPVINARFSNDLVTGYGSGGIDALPRQFPHMALIGYGDASSIEWWCGGSLISDKHVLSAAHCSMSGRGRARWARLGEYNFQSTEDEEWGKSGPVDYEILEIINHPSYNSSSVYNDITLFKMNTTVVFTEFIRPVYLHTDYTIPEGIYHATGWGITSWGGRQSSILQIMDILIIPSIECQDDYSYAVGTILDIGIDDRTMICAGDVKRGINTCKGDSGGPLQVDHPDFKYMHLQFGITSVGSVCGGNLPGIYTRVSPYIAWIESVVWP